MIEPTTSRAFRFAVSAEPGTMRPFEPLKPKRPQRDQRCDRFFAASSRLIVLPASASAPSSRGGASGGAERGDSGREPGEFPGTAGA
ncbi:hypothetical protein ABEV74_22975, partial [Paenibacillus cisolokensis]|uniref:hypothetical protein n=1 Tax=Paenibacillus cisolokensis TaxID=1658519 RepID=UPI003D2BFBE6